MLIITQTKPVFIPHEVILALLLDAMTREECAPHNGGKDFVFDGMVHRYHVEGDRLTSKNGAYRVYPGDGLKQPPAGWFMSWKTTEKRVPFKVLYTDLQGGPYDDIYRAWRSCAGPAVDVAAIVRAQAEKRELQMKKEAEAARIAAQDNARYWRGLPQADPNHPYLVRKRVKAYPGVKQDGTRLVIPLITGKQSEGGAMQSIQFIAPNGGKWFKRGSHPKGAFFAMGDGGNVVLICEGYATGATLYELAPKPITVICAMNCDNLASVVAYCRKHMAGRTLIIAADDDNKTPGNPGMTTALKAGADAVIIPPFDRARGDVGTDWNDFMHIYGRKVTAALLAACIDEITKG